MELQGILPNLSKCASITGPRLDQLLTRNAVENIFHLCALTPESTENSHPQAIQSLITELAEVFKKHTQLPPHRKWDHQLPLMAGALPV